MIHLSLSYGTSKAYEFFNDWEAAQDAPEAMSAKSTNCTSSSQFFRYVDISIGHS